MRQEVVDLARELQRIDGLVRAQMRDLRGRVNAGIGAARTADVAVAEDLRGRAQQVALDRFRRVTLRLPARVPRSLVLDRELVSRHAARVVPGCR